METTDDNNPGEGEGIPASLFIHEGLPTQVAVTRQQDQELDPITIDRHGGHIHFQIKSSTNEIIDISKTLLKLNCRMLNGNGNLIANPRADNTNNDNDRATVVNGLCSALFKNVEVRLNNSNMSTQDGMYAYRADMDTRLTNSVARKKGALSAAGWDEEEITFDDQGENTGWYDGPENSRNEAIKRRFNRNKGSKPFTVIGRIHSDIFEQPKMLPPNTTVDIKFDRNSQEFILLTNETPLDHKLYIESCQLIVRKCEVSPEIIVDMINETRPEKPYKYPIREVVMTYFTKTQGTTDLSSQNILRTSSCLPRRVIVGLVDQEAFNGSVKKDPFNFQHFGTNYVCLRVGGQISPYPEIVCDPEHGDFSMPFYSIIRGTTGFENGEEDLGITIYNIARRCFFIVWNISPSDTPAGSSVDMENRQNMDVIWRITQPLTRAVTMIVFAEYDNAIECDENGHFYKTDLKQRT